MFRFLATLSVLALGAGAASAAELRSGKIALHEVVRGTELTFEVESWPDDAHGVMMIIDGPGEYYAELQFKNEVPRVDLAKYGKLEDGFYDYEIRVGTSEKIKLKERVNNGRNEEREFDLASIALGSRLVLERGRIVEFEQGEEKGSEKPIEMEDVDDSDKGYKK